MTIKNWDFQKLNMDYSSMYKEDHPSDIDMFYLCRDHTLIIGEIKNNIKPLKKGQRWLLSELVNGWKYDAIAVFITHDKFYQNGDRKVDVPSCEVREIYTKAEKKWRPPKKETTAGEILEWYKKRRQI